MAANKSHEASSSSSSGRWRYDVFLSFRGEDTRTNITDHLFKALQNAGINDVFRDDNELRVGENISTELLEAIQDSRISIIVFSRDYAASSWCLEELTEIMECRKTVNQVVFPVFYKVDPSDVRKQRGSFEEAFAQHEKRFVMEKEKVLRWRDALTEAANLKGYHCTLNRHEGEFIEEIVEEILNHLDNTYLNEAIYPVGLVSRVKKVISLLRVGANDDVRIIGICAMGGMGKTTIAKSVYNYFFHCFKHKSFLANVREISKQPNGQVHLQEQLLFDILNKKNRVSNVDRGITLIKERLCKKRVLMVLDDVDELQQLSTLARKHDWFGFGSRIIITTRDEHLLKEIEADDIYMVHELNDDESLELFSWHAFRRSHPKENYVELSKDVVDYCKGLPLALEVLGSFLFKKSALEWKNASDKLKRIPHDQIQKKLRISFDALGDRNVKDIFLDIACFFIGVDKDYAATILDGCGFFAEIGISVLIHRCLLTINHSNKLVMHDLLRDMGREVIREECPKELGNCSRLWSHDDILDVLKKRKGTKAVEGLILELPMLNEEHFRTEAFANMDNLRLLQLNYVDINGRYHHFSKELRWVCWHGFPLKFIPKNFHLESVVVLDMRYSKLSQFSKEIEVLKKLKVLDLSHSYDLTKTPNFSKIPNLEKLKLKDCRSLVKVHPSIGNLHRLVLLDMRDCEQLKSLPDSICMLKSLEILNLSGCSKFERLPNDIGDMEALVELLADKTTIRQVPTSIVHLKKIKKLSLCGCRGLTSRSSGSTWSSWVSQRESPNSISLLLPSLQGLTSLRRLTLKNCNLSDDIFPKDIQSLSSLEYLDLSGNNFCSLPASISNLSRLHYLQLYCCTSLRSLPELPTRLHNLIVQSCLSLERVPNMSRLPGFVGLYSWNCPKLVVVPGLEELINDAIIFPLWCNNILAASTLKEHMIQNPPQIYIFGQFWMGHGTSFPSSSLSLVLLQCFEDAGLVTYISYKHNPFTNLVISYGDKLEVEICSTDKNLGVKKKWKVHPYDKPEGGSSQPNGVEEILQETDSDGNTMITGSGRWNGNIFWRLFQYFCHPGYDQEFKIDITKINN